MPNVHVVDRWQETERLHGQIEGWRRVRGRRHAAGPSIRAVVRGVGSADVARCLAAVACTADR